ncbi:IS110 family transposase [Methylocystis sp. IM2]|uniref:IS110 family transposase n=1 Tax=unclassified Methylocystis TaxID=2625913 RepID=UPI0030F4BA9F
MINHSSQAAGIDIGKAALDMALTSDARRWRFANDDEGREELVAELRSLGVVRVGLEASGGYERAVVERLRSAGFDVVLFQPRQVRAYAAYRLRRAKNDAIDAGLIAACAAEHGPARGAPDPRLVALAEPLRLLEQTEDDISRLKTRSETYRSPEIRAVLADEIKRLKASRAAQIKRLRSAITAEPDLARRFELVVSIAGIGERTALTLLIAMPELGAMSREQAASLAGLAPFDRDSGKHEGRRTIAGGRTNVRTALYAAALPAAFKWNVSLVALYRRLKARGNPHKKALIACARKLLIYVNAVLARATPWQAA